MYVANNKLNFILYFFFTCQIAVALIKAENEGSMLYECKQINANVFVLCLRNCFDAYHLHISTVRENMRCVESQN